MPPRPHLLLVRAEVNFERRRRPGFGARPPRDFRAHGQTLERQVNELLERRQNINRPLGGVEPSLILRVRTTGGLTEDAWEAAGLTVIATNADDSFVLFSSDNEIEEFRRRLAAYRGGPVGVAQTAPYSSLVAAIEEVGQIRPADRIGPLLRGEGIVQPNNFEDGLRYSLDAELWSLGTRDRRAEIIQQMEAFLHANGGEISDRYVGRNLTMLRVHANGAVMRAILEIDAIAVLDRPPQPDELVSAALDLGIQDLPAVHPPNRDAPCVAILDTGISSEHPLIAPAVRRSISVPERLGPADTNGHGTKVAGIAMYGDVRACADVRRFAPSIWISSAKVVTDQGRFDDRSLIASQIRTAMQLLHEGAGSRVFNISLGDRRLIYGGGKVGAWAAALDEIARDLNVVVVVSAGNFEYVAAPEIGVESHVLDFPRYLLQPESRIVEPATAAIALTVGAIANVAGVPPQGGAEMRPIARIGQPSPFTRSGPGAGGAIKPEFVDYGGNLMFDGLARNVSDNWAETSVLTLRASYLQNLLTTAAGTSFAAPKVAFKAARLFQNFPNASANLIRALLASSAEIPVEAVEILSPFGADAVTRVCGLGVPDEVRAATSDDNRVVLYADSVIELDQCLIFEVPMVEDFVVTRGRRRIQVSLAFDPPVRHTRVDYLGARMSFRLIRGASLEDVTEHFRRRVGDEVPVPEMPARFQCKLEPGPMAREKGTLQTAAISMARAPAAEYGDTYYLVVRCERRWADDDDAPQRFAVVVELSHTAEIPLYERVQQRVELRVRQRV